MSNLYESELYDIIPNNFKAVEVEAFCYALDKQVVKLLDCTEKLNLYGNLLEADESLLDYLAVELRTQYYDVNLDIDTKRQLLYNTFRWYKMSGTVSAVRDMLYTIFGTACDIEEWFEYNGEPSTFKITTDEVLTLENMSKFVDVIDKVKDVTARIEGFNKIENFSSKTYVGMAILKTRCIRIG